MDYRLLDDATLDLAYRQAITDREADKSVEKYKIYARLKFEFNRRRAITNSSKPEFVAYKDGYVEVFDESNYP